MPSWVGVRYVKWATLLSQMMLFCSVLTVDYRSPNILVRRTRKKRIGSGSGSVLYSPTSTRPP